ncbi:helix-turn-helix transcriptional regulator [Yoonia sp.]|uniref:helix-turn-helix transcriptional regulator n=1 Tax=Yoonia sp. TaxID=2212373 RepID=UPI001A02A6E7|nr:helix-turn-helix transcriptional regulator [Yoonia sp.]MBE0414718.1 helix-turn-helix transcriptional regulator [Yoonia sp.]
MQGKLERLTYVMAVIQLVCGLGFGVDLILEFPDPRVWAYLGPEALIHLLSELLIMLLLLIGFGIARQIQRYLELQSDSMARDLRSLRGDFDSILHRQFESWQLTAAQRDVALLCLRGLRISDIAAIRGSAEGTVKAHFSAIFRAANVRTRSEFVALFMEEFIEHGTIKDHEKGGMVPAAS